MKIYHSLEEAVAAVFGNDVSVTGADRVAGGDINHAFRLHLSDGTDIFMKSNKKENLSFFLAEAAGLDAIAQTRAIGTPRLLCLGTDKGRGGFSFLIMEWIGGKGPVKHYWEIFAKELAAMHCALVESIMRKFSSVGKYGFYADNYIGSSEQMNAPCSGWVSFFREFRLEKQFHRAERYFGPGDLRKAASLLEHLDDFLVEPEQPSLLHGDLWSGNVIAGNDGKAWIIDPAVYVGHAEADIAMTELFGRFPREFYAVYRENGLLQPGYERRRDLYNLYHLLNHLNLFGSSYLPSVMQTLREYCS